MSRPKKPPHRADPALLTGTSSEYLGRRALPRIVRERSVVFLFGPPGVGKTSVARHLAGPDARELDSAAIQAALVDQVGRSTWPAALRNAPRLILDGPRWLSGRPAATRALGQLLHQRAKNPSLRTFVVQADDSAALEALMATLETGQFVTLGLRFPVGRGRIRSAYRVCDARGIPRIAAKGAEALEPWSYDALFRFLEGYDTDR